jgi:hypothetical protein
VLQQRLQPQRGRQGVTHEARDAQGFERGLQRLLLRLVRVRFPQLYQRRL